MAFDSRELTRTSASHPTSGLDRPVPEAGELVDVDLRVIPSIGMTSGADLRAIIGHRRGSSSTSRFQHGLLAGLLPTMHVAGRPPRQSGLDADPGRAPHGPPTPAE